MNFGKLPHEETGPQVSKGKLANCRPELGDSSGPLYSFLRLVGNRRSALLTGGNPIAAKVLAGTWATNTYTFSPADIFFRRPPRRAAGRPPRYSAALGRKLLSPFSGLLIRRRRASLCSYVPLALPRFSLELFLQAWDLSSLIQFLSLGSRKWFGSRARKSCGVNVRDGCWWAGATKCLRLVGGRCLVRANTHAAPRPARSRGQLRSCTDVEVIANTSPTPEVSCAKARLWFSAFGGGGHLTSPISPRGACYIEGAVISGACSHASGSAGKTKSPLVS